MSSSTFSELRRTGLLATLTDRVRSGRTSATQLTELAVRRIEAGADLNAVVATDVEAALHAAAQVDRDRDAGRVLPPLAGLPVLIKDNLDAVGFRTTFGSLVHRNAPAAERDDTVVSQLRAAGAVVVGKTNLPEFAMESFTDNRLWGATHNPWRRGVSPGGSSGGSAAALAAGLVPIATGTDGGGSSRIPAAACGLAGLKPTSGTVGNRHARLPIELSSVAPLAGTLADLELLAELTCRAVAGDPSCVYGFGAGEKDSSMPVGDIFAVLRVTTNDPIAETVAKAFVEAANELGVVLNRRVNFLDAPPFGDAVDEDWATVYAAEDAFAMGWDVAQARRDDLDSRVVPWIDRGMNATLADYLGARSRRNSYVRVMDDLLAGGNLLISPVSTMEALLVDGSLGMGADPGSVPMNLFNTSPFNFTGHPAVSVPAGDITGLPFGLQVVAARGADRWLLHTLRAWESAHPWPLVAPGYSVFLEGGSDEH